MRQSLDALLSIFERFHARLPLSQTSNSGAGNKPAECSISNCPTSSAGIQPSLKLADILIVDNGMVAGSK
ncbi:hypothetical protein [Microcoleus sp. CAWBG58]|uniref:hypothetical protein n=1 Tax=Microcoleus sp. CAWBG58 TaxID=2841651 RepID=UPI0025ED9112|nr:hypothetical protein [Microcoleus sp. CAWBG58]